MLEDLTDRYTALLVAADGTATEAAALRSEAENLVGHTQPLGEDAAERLWGFARQREAVRAFAFGEGLTAGAPVVLAGLTKHAGITHAAAVAAGLSVVAVADDGPAFQGLRLRATPVVPAAEALERRAEAVLHTDLNPGRPRPAPGRLPSLFLRDAYGTG